MDGFNQNILEIIERYSYEFFVVKTNQNINCTCVSFETKQSSPACPKCLGTGKKITIKKISGASQETPVPSAMRYSNEVIMARNYYVKYNYPMTDTDMIVDKGEVYSVYRVRPNLGFHGERVYQKCLCAEKKFDTEIFLKNFNSIIRGG